MTKIKSKFHALLEKLIEHTISGELEWQQNSKDDQSFVLDFPIEYKDKIVEDGKDKEVVKKDILKVLIAHVREQQFKYVFNVQRGDMRATRLEVSTVGASLDKLVVQLFDEILTKRANFGLLMIEKNVPTGTTIEEVIASDKDTDDDCDVMKLIDQKVVATKKLKEERKKKK